MGSTLLEIKLVMLLMLVGFVEPTKDFHNATNSMQRFPNETKAMAKSSFHGFDDAYYEDEKQFDTSEDEADYVSSSEEIKPAGLNGTSYITAIEKETKSTFKSHGKGRMVAVLKNDDSKSDSELFLMVALGVIIVCVAAAFSYNIILFYGTDKFKGAYAALKRRYISRSETTDSTNVNTAGIPMIPLSSVVYEQLDESV